MVLEVSRGSISRNVLATHIASCVQALIVRAHDTASLFQMHMLMLLHLTLKKAPIRALITLEGRCFAMHFDHVVALPLTIGELHIANVAGRDGILCPPEVL